MKTITGRFSGILLISTSILGVLVALGGLYVTWRVLPVLSRSATEVVQLMDASLESSADLLDVLDVSLENVVATFSTAEDTLANTSAALNSTSVMAGSVGGLVGEGIGSLISQTHSSLSTVQASARLVDDTLFLVSKLPLLGARYAPETSLEESITGVTDSLDTMPAMLTEVQSSMEDTSVDIDALQADVDVLSGNLGEIKARLAEAQLILGNYKGIVSEAQDALEMVKAQLTGGIRLLGWVASAVMVWLLLAQLGLFLQGLSLLQKPAQKTD